VNSSKDKIPLRALLFRLGTLALVLALAAVWLLPVVAWAAGGGKPATKIFNVADTRAIEPGVSKWIADIYNSSLWLYGGLVVVMMAGMGFVLGYGMDRLVRLSGINLGKLDHHE